MNGLHDIFQQVMLHLALVGLAVVGLVAVVVFCAAPVWEAVRRWMSLGAVKMTVVAVIVGGFIQYGATKSSFQWDTGLRDNGSYTTNDTVRIAWTYQGIPAESTVYIDCRRNDMNIVKWYSDEGESGAKYRPGFDEIVYGEVSNPPIQAVVVAK